MTELDLVNQEYGCSDTSCVRRLHRFNAADENNGWSLAIHKELKYLTQNNVRNLITCSSDHGSEVMQDQQEAETSAREHTGTTPLLNNPCAHA
ncbi:unnamed protein product [Arabis nemorensis]|uniref:Uncharacterized protein n=1 Tax=Arabis nemorensis TaxID=586526 RepID=A0A565AVC1_9BRAS|nr:unnamed protein product [Arabis nemorensis]